jgi:hypothetical protein
MAREADLAEDADHADQSYVNMALTFADNASEKSLRNLALESTNEGRET